MQIALIYPLSQSIQWEAGRADTITEEKLRVLKEAGVSRISINPQTFNDAVLQVIGRKHTAADVLRCYEMARKIGHTCINMDFIAGLPTDTEESFQNTINTALALAPENITIHTLSVKRASNLMIEGIFSVEELANPVERMVDFAQESLLDHGYHPYYLYKQKNTPGNLENVGYCQQDTEGALQYLYDGGSTFCDCMWRSGGNKAGGPGEPPYRADFNFKYPLEYLNRFEEILKRKEQVIPFYQET